MQKAARQEVTVGGLEAGYGQRTCFVWPIQRSENILISCQSHEISHKNVDFWLLLKNRKSDKLALTPTWQSVTAAGRGRPSVDKAGILCSSQSPLLPPSPIYNTRLAPCLYMARRTPSETQGSAMRPTYNPWRPRKRGAQAGDAGEPCSDGTHLSGCPSPLPAASICISVPEDTVQNCVGCSGYASYKTLVVGNEHPEEA